MSTIQAVTGKRFTGKTVFISGGGSGMGKTGALRMAREGANVAIFGRREAELRAAAQQIEAGGGVCFVISGDVSREEDVRQGIEATVERFGQLDLAWNNAGILGGFDAVHLSATDTFDQVMGINMKGVYLALKYQIQAMLKAGNKGAIVNTSSWTAHGAVPGTAAYAASKAGLDAMMRTVSLEVGGSGIRINNVAPGIIGTPMSRAALGDEQSLKPFRLHTPLQRIGEPDDVAAAVCWLLSDDASFITGQSLLIDGGFTLGGLRPWLNETVAKHFA